MDMSLMFIVTASAPQQCSQEGRGGWQEGGDDSPMAEAERDFVPTLGFIFNLN